MATGKSSIEWTDRTWNPIRGCRRVSPGCQNCYAEGIAARFSGPGQPFEGYAARTESGPRWTGKVKVIPHILHEPYTWKKPQYVFVNSMSDWLHNGVTDESIREIFRIMVGTSKHTYQLLTKRPERLRDLKERRVLPQAERCTNVHFGVSVENNDYVNRVAILREVFGVDREYTTFISAEPLLGPLPDLNLEGISWLITGAESGPGARPMNEDWVRELRDKAQASNTAFFYKQAATAKGKKIPLPELDGKVWAQMPAKR